MSRDLSIFHLATAATVEDVTPHLDYGTVRFLTPSDSFDNSGVRYYLQENAGDAAAEPISVAVEVDGAVFRKHPLQESPPLTKFTVYPKAGADGRDILELPEYPGGRIRLKYYTEEESRYRQFQVAGIGFTYVTQVLLGGVPVEYQTLSDRLLVIKVPSTVSQAVVVDNIQALIDMDDAPGASAIIFDISTRAKAATGKKALLQRFITLLMSPDGANLKELRPTDVTSPNIRTVFLQRIGIAIQLTKTVIQKNTPADAPADEVLLSASVTGISIDDATGDVTASVDLRTLSGASLTVPLAL